MKKWSFIVISGNNIYRVGRNSNNKPILQAVNTLRTDSRPINLGNEPYREGTKIYFKVGERMRVENKGKVVWQTETVVSQIFKECSGVVELI